METDICVIGAGVVGLAVAARLSRKHDVVVLESNLRFGQETSSRNSEVIHSGIYYGPRSQKTGLCIRGRELLYEYCKAKTIPFLACGKYLISTDSSEEARLEERYHHCRELGVPLTWASRKDLELSQPFLRATRALFFPKTGIVDSEELMRALEQEAIGNGATFAYAHTLRRAEREQNGWNLTYENGGTESRLFARRVVNAAGLAAAEISNQALQTTRYEHRYCAGRYFALNGKYRSLFKHLIYPLPSKDGLGIHVTLDLQGEARLGPDTAWLETASYSHRHKCYNPDWEKLRPIFFESARKYLPNLQLDDLSPGFAGIRPKLFVDTKPYPDFLIEEHEGWTHLLGIESPGLTSCLALAEQIEAD